MKDEGYSNAACADKVGRSAKTVGKWWRKYEAEGEDLKKRNSPDGPRLMTSAEDGAMIAASLL